MAAPQNNQFWKLRTKHGRGRVITDYQILASASDEYFQWCIDNPIIELDFMNSGGKIVEVKKPHPRVFKKDELARFCHLSQWRSIDDLKKISEDFLQVITRIEGIIADQKYTYAVVGMFNSNIVARDLGLSDKSEVEHSGSIITGIDYVVPKD